jgi:hypothetical protein
MSGFTNWTIGRRTMESNLFRRCCEILIVLLFLALVPAYADEVPESEDFGRWNWSASIGAASWSDLSDLQITGAGQFDSMGFALELAAHKHITRWGSADVLAGVDLGLFTTDSDVPGLLEQLTQRGLYLTPSVKLRFGERARRYWNLEAGAGWYNTDFAELDCDGGSICAELRAPFNSDAVGGYLGLSGGFGRWFIAGLKVHYADFGPVRGVGTVSGDLKGPIYIFSLGGAFGG